MIKFKKSSMQILFIVALGLLPTAYSVYTFLQDQKKDKLAAEQNAEIIRLNKDLIAEQKKSNQALEDAKAIQDDLIAEQKKANKALEEAKAAQQAMIDYTTGGDSFPYIQLTDWAGNIGTVTLVNSNPANHSINPLRNLDVNIYDLRKFVNLLEVEKKSARDVRNESNLLRAYTPWLSPHTATEIGQIDVGEFIGGERKFNATIEASGKFYSEQIVIRKKLGQFYFGICLRDVDNNTLKITYQPGFLDEGELQYNFSVKTYGRFSADESGNLIAK
ncbi:MAG: hypothetical protein ACK5TU_05725 [Cyclobacteriaceae bacterium]|jgi:hypothetical protein